MASRQEEKEQRRREREEAEAKHRASAARARRLQIVGGVILGLAVIAVAIVLISGSGGDGGDGGATANPTSNAKIPAATDLAKPASLDDAAKAAGCVVRDHAEEGREHTTDTVTSYKTNPPTSGNHNPTPAEDGVYDADNTPAKENYVHTLEHGRIEIQYRPGTPQSTVDQLETLFNEELNGTAGYHQLLFQNNTNMPYAVAATAWTHLIGCKTMNPKVFDAIRSFRERYVDKAPEQIP